MHSPHCSFIDCPVGLIGASVRTVVHLTLGPLLGVINKQLFPIHPRPDRLAPILCENAAHIRSSSICFVAGIGSTA